MSGAVSTSNNCLTFLTAKIAATSLHTSVEIGAPLVCLFKFIPKQTVDPVVFSALVVKKCYFNFLH